MKLSVQQIRPTKHHTSYRPEGNCLHSRCPANISPVDLSQQGTPSTISSSFTFISSTTTSSTTTTSFTTTTSSTTITTSSTATSYTGSKEENHCKQPKDNMENYNNF